MNRTIKKYTASLTEDLKTRILLWAQRYDEIIWLDSNNYEQGHSSYQAMLAVDAFTSIKTDHHNAFEKLEEYQSLSNDWLFGYLTYDLKNDVELLKSRNFDGLNFPDLYFFQPKKVFLFSENNVELQYLNIAPTTPPPSATTVVSRFAPVVASMSIMAWAVSTVLFDSPAGNSRVPVSWAGNSAQAFAAYREDTFSSLTINTSRPRA